MLDAEEATFDRVAQPHREQTRRQSSGTWLILDDTSEINFGRFRQAKGLGPVGRNSGRGFLLHSGLMVSAENEDVVGLAGQVLHYRQPKRKDETQPARYHWKSQDPNQTIFVPRAGDGGLFWETLRVEVQPLLRLLVLQVGWFVYFAVGCAYRKFDGVSG